MSCFGWLDVGTFLDEAFVFPTSQFYGEEFKGFFLSSLRLSLSPLNYPHFLRFCDFSFLRAPATLFFLSQVQYSSFLDFISFRLK